MLRSVLNLGRSSILRCLGGGPISSLSTEAPKASTIAADSEADVDAVTTLDDSVPNEDDVLRAMKQKYSSDAIARLKLDQHPLYVEREWWKKGKRMTFWATWRQLRDVNRREVVQETGADRMRLKALKWNTVLPQAIRDAAADELHNMPKYSRPRLILNMCMFTGRQRGKIKRFRVNRHLFRKYADRSQLSGVQRAMW